MKKFLSILTLIVLLPTTVSADKWFSWTHPEVKQGKKFLVTNAVLDSENKNKGWFGTAHHSTLGLRCDVENKWFIFTIGIGVDNMVFYQDSISIAYKVDDGLNFGLGMEFTKSSFANHDFVSSEPTRYLDAFFNRISNGKTLHIGIIDATGRAIEYRFDIRGSKKHIDKVKNACEFDRFLELLP